MSVTILPELVNEAGSAHCFSDMPDWLKEALRSDVVAYDEDASIEGKPVWKVGLYTEGKTKAGAGNTLSPGKEGRVYVA